LHLVGILFPHINDDARSKSHQVLRDVSSTALKITLAASIYQHIYFEIVRSSCPVRLKNRIVEKQQ